MFAGDAASSKAVSSCLRGDLDRFDHAGLVALAIPSAILASFRSARRSADPGGDLDLDLSSSGNSCGISSSIGGRMYSISGGSNGMLKGMPGGGGGWSSPF